MSDLNDLFDKHPCFICLDLHTDGMRQKFSSSPSQYVLFEQPIPRDFAMSAWYAEPGAGRDSTEGK